MVRVNKWRQSSILNFNPNTNTNPNPNPPLATLTAAFYALNQSVSKPCQPGTSIWNAHGCRFQGGKSLSDDSFLCLVTIVICAQILIVTGKV
jgi:hypothetical protein